MLNDQIQKIVISPAPYCHNDITLSSCKTFLQTLAGTVRSLTHCIEISPLPFFTLMGALTVQKAEVFHVGPWSPDGAAATDNHRFIKKRKIISPVLFQLQALDPSRCLPRRPIKTFHLTSLPFCLCQL